MPCDDCSGSRPPAEVRHVHVHRDEGRNSDSIEIGTAGKGGVVKIYGDFANPEDFMHRIDNAVMVRAFTRRKIEESTEAAAPATNEQTRWVPTITRGSWDKMQAQKKARDGGAASRPPETPTAAGQAEAAVRKIVKTGTTTTKPANLPVARGEEVCAGCGAAVAKSQAKLSQLFMNKALCKQCLEISKARLEGSV